MKPKPEQRAKLAFLRHSLIADRVTLLALEKRMGSLRPSGVSLQQSAEVALNFREVISDVERKAKEIDPAAPARCAREALRLFKSGATS